MSKRVSIMLDEDLLAKLRMLQGKKIKHTGKSVSFSRIICDTLHKDL